MQLALLGYPLSHSVSPAMHTAALAELGLSAWTYQPWPVAPEYLAAAVARLREPDYAGANVTVPHKATVMPYLDGLTPVAAAIGAVNTIVKHEGRLLGHNTDAAGLLADLYTFDVKLARRTVLILGAGGAARAAVAACLGVGARVRVLARQRAQAEALRSLGDLEIYDWSPLGWLAACDGVSMVLNATSVGMSPKVDASPWLLGTPFPLEAFIYDLVYNPPVTRLVREAEAAGLRATTGLGMLVEQGALALERWTGQAAPRAVMRRAADAALAGLTTPPAAVPSARQERLA
jgi:shikimate dehydrogenase